MKLHERLGAVFKCRLDSSARMILTVIATASDEDDRPVWFGADTIAARAGLSRSTTIDLLRRLTIAGVLVEGERVQGASVRRHIDWPRLASLESLPTRPKSGRVQSSDGSNPRTGPESGRVQSSDWEGSNPRTPGVQISDPRGPILGRGESEFRTRSVIYPSNHPSGHPSDDPSDERARPDPSPEVPDARLPQPTPTHEPQPPAHRAASGAGGPPTVGGIMHCSDVPGGLAAPGHRGGLAVPGQPTGASPTTTHQPGAPAAVLPRDHAAAPATTPASDPDLGTRRVAPARWEDDDAYVTAVQALCAVEEAITAKMARRIEPNSPASRAIADGLTALGHRYQRRLELIAEALHGRASTPAAHEVARIARALWLVPKPGAKPDDALNHTMATIRRASPSEWVAAVDRSIADGVPLVPPPERRAPARQQPAQPTVTVEGVKAVLRARGIHVPGDAEVIDV